MNIECLDTGVYDSNVYFIWNENSNDAVIIDAGAKASQVLELLQKHELTAKYIILTHNHFDHMSYTSEIKKLTGAKVAAHKNDALGLNDPHTNGSAAFSHAIAFDGVDMLLEDGDKIDLGGLIFEIIHTPGHTPGCISIKVNDHLFTGDTLFKGTIGRTDFPNSDTSAIYKSIQYKLFTLPRNTKVYPGHGSSTSIDYEIKNNFVVNHFDI